MDILIEGIKDLTRFKMRKRNANRASTICKQLFINVCLFNYICCLVTTVLGNTIPKPLSTNSTDVSILNNLNLDQKIASEALLL